MKATIATTPKLKPTPARFRPAPAVTTGVDNDVALAEAEPAPEAPELEDAVGTIVVIPETAALVTDTAVPLL